MNKNKLFASVIGLLFFVAGLSAKDYQVAMFGIKSDGVIPIRNVHENRLGG